MKMEGTTEKVRKMALNLHEIQPVVKNGTIQRIFEEMQKMNIIDVRSDVLCIDSTSIKVHPDAAGARKTNEKQSIGRSKGG